jgi:uncharacterized protein DUF2786/SprT-like family protein
VEPIDLFGWKPAQDAPRLTAELEAAVVRALQRDWEAINYSHFRHVLKPPIFLLGDAASRLGRWSPADRTLEISRQLVLEQPWGVVLEVLKHEMAHQFAHEAMRAQEETAHGEAFRRACAVLGIDPAASGLPSGSGALPDEEARVLRRIAKLLALGGSDNQHEAEVAMREAHRLMLKHNLSGAGESRRRGYGFRHLGEPTGRLQAHQRVLGAILGSHFFVEPIWVSVHRAMAGSAGTVLEVCGTEANLEMASYVHDFLLRTAEHLWIEHRRSTGLRGDAQRRSFLVGVMRGFSEKLDAQRQENRREGLVLKRDTGLGDFLRTRYPRQRSMRSTARADPAAFREGQKAGRTIVIQKPIATTAKRGHALPPKRS